MLQQSAQVPRKEDEYEVERIVGRRTFQGKIHYLIKWFGYPPSQNTWEPEENLINIAKMVDEFESKRAQKEARKKLGKKHRKRSIHKQSINDPGNRFSLISTTLGNSDITSHNRFNEENKGASKEASNHREEVCLFQCAFLA